MSEEGVARIHAAALDALATIGLADAPPSGIEAMTAAGAELVAMDTPPKVAIAEFVDVATAFFPEGKEARFVNAVLDHMARAARPEAF